MCDDPVDFVAPLEGVAEELILTRFGKSQGYGGKADHSFHELCTLVDGICKPALGSFQLKKHWEVVVPTFEGALEATPKEASRVANCELKVAHAGGRLEHRNLATIFDRFSGQGVVHSNQS